MPSGKACGAAIPGRPCLELRSTTNRELPMILFTWLTFAIAVAVWASKKGRNPFGWVVLAVIISPLIAGVFLALADDKSAPAVEKRHMHLTHVRCPDCRELIRKDASKCKHCGTKLIPDEA
jgi:hypothetical protein